MTDKSNEYLYNKFEVCIPGCVTIHGVIDAVGNVCLHRLLPPVPFTIRQALKPDVLPGNIPIPAGTVLVLCIGAMMR